MGDIIVRVERMAGSLRVLKELCACRSDETALALEPALDKLSLELLQVGLELRAEGGEK